MIIFDLACLANDEHRRHFIDPKFVPYTIYDGSYFRLYPEFYDKESDSCIIPCDPNWKPNYKAYNEACGGDEAIKPVSRTALSLIFDIDTQIWSSQCTSIKEPMVKWITDNIADISYMNQSWLNKLKMRPIDDTRPKEVLFEGCLDELIKNDPDTYDIVNRIPKYPVDFVFSSHKPTIDMFRRRGVFVFDCNQEA